MLNRKPMKAILILGPTGTGKTPLGQHLAQRGLAGESCRHFDFGEALRNAGPSGVLTADELAVVRRVLTQNALLEDSEFSIAKKLLGVALDEARAAGDGYVVLNGLPRHVGQAGMMDNLVAVEVVVQLACTSEVVHARIENNAGGDRTHRVDDSSAEVEKKLEIYRARTAPLISHYRERGARICRMEVGIETEPADIVERLEKAAVEDDE